MKKYTITEEQLEKIQRILYRTGKSKEINEIRLSLGFPRWTESDGIRWTRANRVEKETEEAPY